MQTVLLVCVILTTISIITGTVYFIFTMIQVKKTGREIEKMAQMINAASPIFSLLFLGGNLITTVTNKIKNLFAGKEKGGKTK